MHEVTVRSDFSGRQTEKERDLFSLPVLGDSEAGSTMLTEGEQPALACINVFSQWLGEKRADLGSLVDG